MEMIVWITGQPGSGKTTLVNLLDVDYVIDGDDLRMIMPNPGYDEMGRRQNIDRAQSIASYLASRGHKVGVSLIAPYRDQRERYKQDQIVCEIYLTTDEIRGREHFFVKDYEPPENPDLHIDTGRMDVDEAVRSIHRTMATVASRTRLADPPKA